MKARAEIVPGSEMQNLRDRYVAGVGAYAPLLRLDRAAAAKALKFSGLGGRAAGFRAVAGWDEDALTLAVEAARFEVGRPDAVIFASTSAPFLERSHATLLVDALALDSRTRTNEVSGTRRCAVAALLDALLGRGEILVAAGEKRPTAAASGRHLSDGDGGAAALISDRGAARLVAHASLSHDLVDIYASREHPEPYAYEERFVRETTIANVIAPTIKSALANARIDPKAIAWAVVHEPIAGSWRDIARATGVNAPNSASELTQTVGDLGAAHAMFAFALACARAKPGDHVLLAGFGSGCDALIFEITETVPGANEAAEAVRTGLAFADYVRFLSLTGTLNLDWGVRSEFEPKSQATVLERYGRDVIGFVGGRDAKGNVQFPKSRIPVRPDADGPEPWQDVRLADDLATIVSVTADRLNFTPDPPFWFGLAQFDNGARVMMEFTDADTRGFAVGDRVRMRLRIKSHDSRRGFRTYFWKAAPERRPSLEA
ncbi:MAG: 3-oxoacyl-[acyl-carrier-protein] synthase III C-terminal domain-containing protein [Roseiarcus sp.]